MSATHLLSLDLDRESATKRLAWIAFGAAAVLALIFREAVTASLLAATPACAFREMFHAGCPTCGFTRALASLARGDVARSFAFHPLAIPLLVQPPVAWLVAGAGLRFGRPRVPARWIVRIVMVDAIALFVVWIARLATGSILS